MHGGERERERGKGKSFFFVCIYFRSSFLCRRLFFVLFCFFYIYYTIVFFGFGKNLFSPFLVYNIPKYGLNAILMDLTGSAILVELLTKAERTI